MPPLSANPLNQGRDKMNALPGNGVLNPGNILTFMTNHPPPRFNQGFTLIELSIVLVIIGLIVGGVLVGQDMIGQAGTRAQMAQIEKYNTAANTFKVKFGYLPGDIPDPYASQFGLLARPGFAGSGDGNGVLEGNPGSLGFDSPKSECAGETVVFWRDLSTAGLIEGGYTTATFGFQGWFTPTSTPPLGTVMPPAKIGNGNYIYTYSLGSVNYFGLSAVFMVGGCGQNSTVGITVAQAYNIDKKMDDGLPMSGYVKAIYNGGTKCNGPTASYAMGGSADGYGYYPDGASTPWADCQPVTTATPGTALTCYDNGNVNGSAQQYSTEISTGSGVNCALSFQMQGAAR